MFEGETWRLVEEFPSYYVSNYGRIKHIHRDQARKVDLNAAGFPIVVLFGKNGGESKSRYVRQINQLVATAFLLPAVYSDATSVWHIDGDLQNCKADNLRWDTRSRVLEWNEMHRTKQPRFDTYSVLNTRTGMQYADAFECAMDEGRLESEIVIRAEKGSPRYQYVS